jgi:hypothetical protein
MESPKFNNAEIQRECKAYSDKIRSIHDRVSKMLVGRKARIISNFNGQPYGTSHKSLKGKIMTIKMVSVDETDCQVYDGQVSNCYLRMDEVEFLEDLKCTE